MLQTIRAIIRNGTIELLEPVTLLDGQQVLVTVLAEEEKVFWQEASNTSLQSIWNNQEDDVYAELLTP